MAVVFQSNLEIIERAEIAAEIIGFNDNVPKITFIRCGGGRSNNAPVIPFPNGAGHCVLGDFFDHGWVGIVRGPSGCLRIPKAPKEVIAHNLCAGHW